MIPSQDASAPDFRNMQGPAPKNLFLSSEKAEKCQIPLAGDSALIQNVSQFVLEDCLDLACRLLAITNDAVKQHH